MRIAVIGSGAAGLTATKHLTAPGSGFSCVTYEQTDTIGGLWVYTDAVGRDKYGLPVHTCMYKNLTTKAPKEVMVLSGFPHGGPENQTFIPANLMVKYFNEYAEHFDLKKYIKFHHHVRSVSVLENEKWEVKVVDLVTRIEYTEYFDGVMVCVGIYNAPVMPAIPGMDRFEGRALHSHNYREPEAFRNERLVIVGCGVAGFDITFDVAPFAKQVYLSHHSKDVKHVQFPDKVIQKPDIKYMKKNSVVFTDGTEEEADVILYCTGYTYRFPFLNENVGITVENQYVRPLYKHMINIEHPSLAIIGIPTRTVGLLIFDFQVCFYLNAIKNPSLLPSKEDMKADTKQNEMKRTGEGQRQKDFHNMKQPRCSDYIESLIEVGQLEPVPPVLRYLLTVVKESKPPSIFAQSREDK